MVASAELIHSIKRCHICGAKAVLRLRQFMNKSYYFVECTNCLSVSSNVMYEDPQKCVDEWNSGELIPELKPCPQCGAAAEIISNHPGKSPYWVRCTKCRTWTPGAGDALTVIRRWNRRYVRCDPNWLICKNAEDVVRKFMAHCEKCPKCTKGAINCMAHWFFSSALREEEAK